MAGAKLLRNRLLAKSGGQVGVTLGADAILAALRRYGGIGRIGLIAATMAAAPAQPIHAAVSEEDAVMAVVRQYTGFVNTADRSKAAGLCAPQASIIDDFPPYAWVGAAACTEWWTDLATFEAANAITADHITLRKPRHVAVTGDHAYVVLPVVYTYRLRGKPLAEAGSTWTFALQRLGNGWRITASAWAQH